MYKCYLFNKIKFKLKYHANKKGMTTCERVNLHLHVPVFINGWIVQ